MMKIISLVVGATIITIAGTFLVNTPFFLAAQDKAENAINEATPVEGDILAMDRYLRNKRTELDRAHAQLMGLADNKRDIQKAKEKLDSEISDLKANIDAGLSKLRLSQEPQIQHRGKVYPREQLLSKLEELEDEHTSKEQQSDNLKAAIEQILSLIHISEPTRRS